MFVQLFSKPHCRRSAVLGSRASCFRISNGSKSSQLLIGRFSLPFRPPVFRGPGQVHFASERERKRAYARSQPTSKQRGYDQAWRRLRDELVKRWPKCCAPGCTFPTEEIDHVVSIRERTDLRLDPTNLRPYCKHHHSQRTARDHGFARPAGGTLGRKW